MRFYKLVIKNPKYIHNYGQLQSHTFSFSHEHFPFHHKEVAQFSQHFQWQGYEKNVFILSSFWGLYASCTQQLA